MVQELKERRKNLPRLFKIKTTKETIEVYYNLQIRKKKNRFYP